MPHNKHLKPDPISKPQPDPPPNSVSSSSTTATPPPPPPPSEKRTRDQPNLSDCHSCKRRINHTNPQDRLQPLDSVWRIVLLCRKCNKHVNSGQTCPYCFKGTADSGNILKCRDCKRRIHEDCVRSYKFCAPWCFVQLGLGFSVCIDCWVPDLLKNSMRVCRRRREVKSGEDCSGKGVECEASVKGKGLKKNNCVDLVGKNGGNKGGELSSSDDETEDADDAQLAIQLHRVMNSSPRILRNSSSLDGSRTRDSASFSGKRSVLGRNYGEDHQPEVCSDTSEDVKLLGTSGAGSCFHVNGSEPRLLSYKRDKRRKIWTVLSYKRDKKRKKGTGLSYKQDKERKVWTVDNENMVISESRPCHENTLENNLNSNHGTPFNCDGKILKELASDSGDESLSSFYMRRFSQEPVVYKRTRFKQKVLKENGEVLLSGECGSGGNDEASFASQPEDTNHELPKRDTSSSCPVNSDAKMTMPNGSGSGQPDRYLIKYAKAARGTTSGSNGETNLPPDTVVNEKGESFPAVANNSNASPVKCPLSLLLPNRLCEPDLIKYERTKGAKSGSNGETNLHMETFKDEKQTSFHSLANNSNSSPVTCVWRILPNRCCDTELDRYYFKYEKRVGSKSGLNFHTNLQYDVVEHKNLVIAPETTANCCAESVLPSAVPVNSGPLDKELDRYQFKYRKRVAGSKLNSNCQTNLQSNVYQQENLPVAHEVTANCSAESMSPSVDSVGYGQVDEELDRYFFKYGKRVAGTKSGSSYLTNLQYDVLQCKDLVVAPEVTANCSAKCRLLSVASVDSSPVDQHISAFANALYVEEPKNNR